MLTCRRPSGNISGEATTPSGNIFLEAMWSFGAESSGAVRMQDRVRRESAKRGVLVMIERCRGL